MKSCHKTIDVMYLCSLGHKKQYTTSMFRYMVLCDCELKTTCRKNISIDEPSWQNSPYNYKISWWCWYSLCLWWTCSMSVAPIRLWVFTEETRIYLTTQLVKRLVVVPTVQPWTLFAITLLIQIQDVINVHALANTERIFLSFADVWRMIGCYSFQVDLF
jgi:hypothetical protein